uniref:Acyl carrier protein s-malonyltransacylase n=1 Tax=Gambierdiscus polynesiensis TaxID=439318 RepID=A0A1S6K8J8_9DINO|nr:Acyl carrier protein s-malonyltransacylase [Gambierdiscus polynesiensis]
MTQAGSLPWPPPPPHRTTMLSAFVTAPAPLLQGSPAPHSPGGQQRSAPPAANHGGGTWPFWLALAPLAASRRVQRRHRRARVVVLAAEGISCKTAFLFPGQGAQSVGMCKELTEECPAAKELFDQASGILGYDLLERCIDGPKDLLDTTAVSQPAIFVASMAAVEKMKQDLGEAAVEEATVAMGLSLGEYSALCFAGALDFEDGVRITKARGEAMQAAADAVDSVQIANFLCKGNYTVSGDKEACAKLVEIAKPEFKARMAMPLPVAGAFHTDFMAPAVDKLKEALAAANFKSPRIPVVSNVDAEAHSDPDEIREILAKQVTSPVMWEQQMRAMVAGGFEKGYELGPGKVVSGILKRIDKGAASAMTNFTV